MSDRPRTLLYFPLTLLDKKREFEGACVEALRKLRGVDGLLLAMPSWQEAPDAIRHDFMQWVRLWCEDNGIDVYWGRDLWIRWKGLAKANGWKQRREDVFNPAYYATYLSRLDAEAKAIGARGTFAECEPYGDTTVLKPWPKRTGFQDDGDCSEHDCVVDAIRMAREVAPPADLAYPAGGQHSNHYGWALRHLGNQFLHSKTYQAHGPADLHIDPPDGMQVDLHWWGTWLTAGDYSGPHSPLTIPQWQALDWGDIRVKYLELQGCWLYASDGDLIEVMRQLGAIGDGR